MNVRLHFLVITFGCLVAVIQLNITILCMVNLFVVVVKYFVIIYTSLSRGLVFGLFFVCFVVVYS